MSAIVEPPRGQWAPVPTGNRSTGPDCPCGHHRNRCLFGHTHRLFVPWMRDGRVLRSFETEVCDRCGAVCTLGEEDA